jgi:hypothetical protein
MDVVTQEGPSFDAKRLISTTVHDLSVFSNFEEVPVAFATCLPTLPPEMSTSTPKSHLDVEEKALGARNQGDKGGQRPAPIDHPGSQFLDATLTRFELF